MPILRIRGVGMATERVRRPGDTKTITPGESARIDRTPAGNGHGYRLGPDDLEEFINLGEEGQRRLTETPGALDEWLAAHAAKYE